MDISRGKTIHTNTKRRQISTKRQYKYQGKEHKNVKEGTHLNINRVKLTIYAMFWSIKVFDVFYSII